MQLDSIPIDLLTRSPHSAGRRLPRPSVSMVDSIRNRGCVEPVVCVPAGPQRYEILSGESTWVAAGLAGRESVPCIIRDDLEDDDVREILHGPNNNSNPIAEARELADRRRELSEGGPLISVAKLARRIGKPRAYVAHSLRLLRLPEEVQALVQDQLLTAGHARAILAAATPPKMRSLASRVVRENLSVRSTEDLAQGRPLPSGDSSRQADRKSDNSMPANDTAATSPELRFLEKALSELVGSPVALSDRELTIDYFGDSEVLEGILERLGYKPDF